MSDLNKFQDKFRDEALDNISEMEQALLDLELSPKNHELNEKVFRALHSLKGGGAMFGFDQLSELAHFIENIYENVRSQKLAVSSELLGLTFKSVDLFKDLLASDSPVSPDLVEQCNAIERSFEELKENKFKEIGSRAESKNAKEEDDDNGCIRTYYIHFFPSADILKNGTNLLYLIDDLKELGNLFAIPRMESIPLFNDLNPKNCYAYWDLFLSTCEGVSAISDVFIFVEDESTLEINKISDFDLFSTPRFEEKLNEIFQQNKRVDLSEVKDIGEQIESLVPDNHTDLEKSPNSGENNNTSDDHSSPTRNVSSIKVSSEKIDNLMDLVSELVIAQERLNMIASHHSVPELRQTVDFIQKLTSQLRDSTFSISLVPVESLLTRFQRHIRDLSKEMGKQVQFEATGTETELDKTLIDGLTDPLLHILRNSIDHGIESPEVRQKMGKSPEGTITLHACYSGANVIIEISDDGAGMDHEKIRKKAVSKGMIHPESQLSTQEILELVFLPGFTTSEEVTEVSGRGVGMDVVNNAISAIRGEVQISSTKEVGTKITIVLPLVLSVLDGLLVHVDGSQYVIPLSLVGHIYFINSDDLTNDFNHTISLGGKLFPFIDLREEFNVESEPPKKRQMVVVNLEKTQVALAVDRVFGKIQAVLKPLGDFFSGNKIITAATIMGDGSVGLMLDINALINNSSANISQKK